MKKNSVKIERAWMKILQGLDPAKRANILYNITEYLFCGQITDKITYPEQDIILRMIKGEEIHKQRVSAKRKEAGRMGAQKRWGTETKAEVSQPQPQPTPQSIAQPTSQPIPEKPADIICDKQVQTLLDSSMWLETLAMKFKITTEQVKEYIKRFAIDSNCRGATHNSERELKNHVTNWISIQEQIKTTNNDGRTDKDKRRGFGVTATSWEDYKGAF